MYEIEYMEVTPEGYIEETIRYDSFVIAIMVYKSLISNPFVDAVIYRAGSKGSMRYINKIIPF